MQETLAAGVVFATGWFNDDPFVNPMCGSGTLAIEAALMALNRQPGILRSNFGFMHILGFDSRRWEELRQTARSRERKTSAFPMVATDISGEAVRASRQNARAAGVEDLISFHRGPFEKTPVPQGSGVVLLNPGYGERLGTEKDLASVYGRICDFFKQACQGYRGFVFTGNASLAKKIGLRTSRRISFFNSEIECRLLAYDLYRGSRKGSPVNGGERCLMNVPTYWVFDSCRRIDRRTARNGCPSRTSSIRGHGVFLRRQIRGDNQPLCFEITVFC
jgi:putative N6-adenine-specific DNA methylase